MAHVDESIAAQLTADDDERIECGARASVDAVFDDLARHHLTPGRYADAAVLRRADADVAVDLHLDTHYGFALTAEQAAAYRDRYTAAYLAAWRDPARWKRAEARWKPRGVLLVCIR